MADKVEYYVGLRVNGVVKKEKVLEDASHDELHRKLEEFVLEQEVKRGDSEFLRKFIDKVSFSFSPLLSSYFALLQFSRYDNGQEEQVVNHCLKYGQYPILHFLIV